ncbi:MAG: hypothetical protein AB4063_21115 [Crocosphaera sp.]
MKTACHHLIKATGLNNEAFNLLMITIICSTATTLSPNLTPPTAIVERSLLQDLTLQYKPLCDRLLATLGT